MSNARLTYRRYCIPVTFRVTAGDAKNLSGVTVCTANFSSRAILDFKT
jgi:hypothetical protein